MALCSTASPAQEQETGAAADTTRVYGVVIVDPGIALGKPILLLPPSLQPEVLFEPSLFTDRYSGNFPPFLGGVYEPKVDLISPYLLQRQRDNKLSTLYTVLGAVELGGVAYIAYRHIKKYGFLH